MAYNPSDNGIYSYQNGEYYVKATALPLKTALSTIAHLESKKYTAMGIEIPQKVWMELQARAEEERRAAKENKKRKGQEQKVKKKMKMEEEYKMTHRGNALYTKVHKDGGVVYDCSACRKLVFDYAFNSHVSMESHKEALIKTGYPEDQAFIDAEAEHVRQAERDKAESVYCTACEKWVSKFNYQAHCVGRAHRSKAGGVVTSSGDDYEMPEGPMVNVFCYKSDMWEFDAEYEEVSIAVLEGYKTVYFGNDVSEYGTPTAPSIGLALVKDGTESSLGVCYSVAERTLTRLKSFPRYLAHDLCEIQLKIDDAEHQAFTFIPKNVVKCKVTTVATRLAKAIGPKGPAYTFLAKIVHEQEKQDWHDKYLHEILMQTEKIIWGERPSAK
eukprot:TRINITY_DN1141_c0_g2_i3.p1 TRINITY_DN1141_c0_g2~~TRINITY_DN1141_c0_g2_i3.p1  ORF type:complete len:385 (+),score=103.81 TRINITY_DN1141_c0_g2_i3:75-1229(+)